MSKKLAVFFPGIGYTVDKPLMYYSRKIAAQAGYEVKLLPYGGFPPKILGDRERMTESFRIALQQAEEMLSGVVWEDYEELLFVGKSIGTIVAAKLAETIAARTAGGLRLVLYTPLEETFLFGVRDAIAFTGTGDPWVGEADSRIGSLCEERGLPCIVVPAANHSLETGELFTDLDNLQMIMTATREYIRHGNVDPRSLTV